MKGELSYLYEIDKVFIIGAGFSVPAGLPATKDLLTLLHSKASEQEYYTSVGLCEFGQAEMLLDELKYYYPLLGLTHKKLKSSKVTQKINIEQFLSFISADSAFLYSGGKFNEHGSKFLAFLKIWLGEIFFEKQNELFKKMPSFYSEFVKKLNKSLIITFNWDLLIETLFEEQGIDFRYQLNADDFDKRKNSVPLLKLHGSIDWFSRNYSYLNSLDFEQETGIGSSFEKIMRLKGDLNVHYNNYLSPWIVIPNFDKLNQLREYGDLWDSPWRYLDDKLEVIFIGFSFRKDDFHTRAFLYPKLVYGSRKGQFKVKVIDLAKNEADRIRIKNRFKGIKDCEFWFEGFNKKSIEFIFQ
jgi:hypothetical protein